MSDAKVNRIKGYYSELKKLIENQNYAKVIKIANKIIIESDQEVKAWQCKLTAQIHLGEFKEGLLSIKKCKVLDNLLFEKAYCEYRLNLTSEAWKTISQASDSSSPRIKELKAQILYRLESYDECFAIYRELVKTTSDQFDQERLTNLGAVSVNRIYEGSKERCAKPSSDSSYELLYNYACEILALGQAQEALKQLQNAESLCRKILTQQEGASEEEVNEEVAIIRVQQGHCLQLLRREKESLALYNSVLKTKPDDAALLAITNNNIVAINREGNVFDSKKRLRTTSMAGLEHKLTSRQRCSIALNHCLMAYHTNQDIVESETMQIVKKFPHEELSVATIKAAQLGRAGKLDEAAKVMKTFAKEKPEMALSSLLCAAQILLYQRAVEPTIELLLSLDEKNRFSNGVVSALVVLSSATQNNQLASKVLREAVEWHKKNKSSASHLNALWRQAANFHLRNGDPQTAAASLQELHNLEPSNRNTLAQLISAYSQFDTAMAEKLSKELPDPSSLVTNIDAEALEMTFGPKYSRKGGKDPFEASPASPKGGLKVGATPESGKEKRRQRKKKNRKPRLPKNYIIGEEPDPERWVPRWQRKGYKKKRDRRNKDVMRGTQGVSSDAANKFDITKTAGQQKTQSHVSSPQTESGYKRTVQKKKGVKKKKGAR